MSCVADPSFAERASVEASCFGVLLFILLAILGTAALAGDSDVTVSDAKRDERGFHVHDVRSPYQAGTTRIRVLCPDPLVAQRRYPVVYVLPVEKETESRYGDGLLEIQRRDLHKRHEAIFVAPTFSHLPWYADHPSEPTIRQESYFVKVVVPAVEKSYPAIAMREGRLLLGFSKSGWGAWSLLLRHPDTFGRAAAWDAPLEMEWPSKYGSADIFATRENFDQYRITELIRTKAQELENPGTPRLILTGYGNFRSDHQRTRELLRSLKLPHEFRDGPFRKHDWHSGWVSEAVELLMAPESPRPADDK